MACFTGPNDPVLMNFVRYHSILLLVVVLQTGFEHTSVRMHEDTNDNKKMKKKIKRANGLYLCMD